MLSCSVVPVLPGGHLCMVGAGEKDKGGVPVRADVLVRYGIREAKLILDMQKHYRSEDSGLL